MRKNHINEVSIVRLNGILRLPNNAKNPNITSNSYLTQKEYLLSETVEALDFLQFPKKVTTTKKISLQDIQFDFPKDILNNLSLSSSIPTTNSRIKITYSNENNIIKINITKPEKVSMKWKKFLEINYNINNNKQSRKIQLPNEFNDRICSKDIMNKLSNKLSIDDMKWCQWALNQGGVKVRN
jgi:hypothetical protein